MIRIIMVAAAAAATVITIIGVSLRRRVCVYAKRARRVVGSQRKTFENNSVARYFKRREQTRIVLRITNVSR